MLQLGNILGQSVGRIQRWISQPLVKIFLKTNITANQITVGRALIFLPLVIYFFTWGTYKGNLLALLCMYLYCLFDFVDGGVAVAKNITSRLGRFLDVFLDEVASIIILTGMAITVNIATGSRIVFLVAILILGGRYLISFISNLCVKNFGFHGPIPPLALYEKFKKYRGHKKLLDYFLIFAVDYHYSISQFVFTIAYLYFLGILFNQIYLVLIIVAVATNIKWLALLFVYIRGIDEKPSKSLVINIIKGIGKEARRLHFGRSWLEYERSLRGDKDAL